jgi:hypothetical protein
MLSTILIICLILILLGGVGFAPVDGVTPAARGTVGTVILVAFVIWLFRWSGLF